MRKCVWRPEPRRAEHGRTRRPWPADVARPQRPDPTAAGKCCSDPHPALQSGARLKPAAGQQSFARASRTHTRLPPPLRATAAACPAPCVPRHNPRALFPRPAPRTPSCRVLRTPACAREVAGHSSGCSWISGRPGSPRCFSDRAATPRPLKS